MPTAPTWRTVPRYCGHVADGWYQDATGRFRFEPDPHDAIELAKAKLVLLDLADLPTVPMVSAIAIDGKLPTAEQLASVRRELAKAPQTVLAAWRARGGRAEVIAGCDAGQHPAAPCRCKAFCVGSLLVISGENAGYATLHELAHAHDDVRIRGGRFSSLPEWLAIHRNLPAEAFANDQFQGNRHFRSDVCESFAECFAKIFCGPRNRREVPEAAKRFILWTVTQP